MNTDAEEVQQEFPHSRLEDSVFRMYGDCAVGRKDVCQRCRQSVGEDKLRGPLSIYQVGKEFTGDDQRILFAGKTARDGIYEHEENGVDDVTAFADRVMSGEFRRAGRWAYWSYTRAIIEAIFGSAERGWERVALTNMLKCNCSDTVDASTPSMKVCCLRELGAFRREVELIRPRKIVLYAGWSYDEYLEDMFPEGLRNVAGTDRATTRRCGKKDIPWWQAEVWTAGTVKCHVLRTAHPERKKKAEFVPMVVEWLRQSG
jgi:hypothetical protein